MSVSRCTMKLHQLAILAHSGTWCFKFLLHILHKKFCLKFLIISGLLSYADKTHFSRGRLAKRQGRFFFLTITWRFETAFHSRFLMVRTNVSEKYPSLIRLPENMSKKCSNPLRFPGHALAKAERRASTAPDTEMSNRII